MPPTPTLWAQYSPQLYVQLRFAALANYTLSSCPERHHAAPILPFPFPRNHNLPREFFHSAFRGAFSPLVAVDVFAVDVLSFAGEGIATFPSGVALFEAEELNFCMRYRVRALPRYQTQQQATLSRELLTLLKFAEQR